MKIDFSESGYVKVTTTVKIEAHCSDDKEVVVSVVDGGAGEVFTLQNGETTERYAYDDREITVKERIKT